MRFYQDDIAIVSYSGIFPDHDDPKDFYQGLLDGHCSIRDLTESNDENHLQMKYHFSEDKKEEDKSYSKYGTQISLKRIAQWAKKNDLDGPDISSLEVLLHELVGRMAADVPQLFDDVRTECIIAMGTGEPNTVRIIQRAVYQRFMEKFELTKSEKARITNYLDIIATHPSRDDALSKDLFFSLMYESIRDKYGIEGPCSFIDAACASSVAAISVAIDRLKSKNCDLVISGGLDIGLGVITLVAFSKVQVLSEGIMNPFDANGDGMNQGEAAALFALMRIDDAKKKGLPIHGVIRGCDGSSDGINGSIVEPTERGQVLAYERAYENVPMQPLSYLECHGTGTIVGDKTELSSTAKFFHPLPVIGSAKANVGHTVCAAGAVSLTKALKIIEHKTIPRMPNLKEPIQLKGHQIPMENIELTGDENIRIGISSFGFGGANYHMVVDEYKDEEVLNEDKRPQQGHFQFVLNGTSEVDLNYVYELFSASRLKIPPISLPYYDPAILGATVAVESLFKKLNLKLDAQLREQIGVISASNFFLERFVEFHRKTCYLETLRRLDSDTDPEKVTFLEEELKNFLLTSEDTFSGALNNLIAGKVTKDFDLKGINFNVAAEKTSFSTAIGYAQSLLRHRSGAFIVIGIDEEMNFEESTLDRRAVNVWMVSDLDFALKANLPVKMEISAVKYHREESANA